MSDMLPSGASQVAVELGWGLSWAGSDALPLGAGWSKQARVYPGYNRVRSLEARTP